MTESEVDEEYEKLKKRHLGVLNAESDDPKPSTLEDEGMDPSAPRASPSILRGLIVEQLKTVYDPEIPVNIYDLGLIYDLDVTEGGAVHVRMTLTAPACPVAGALVQEVHDRVRGTPGVARAKTDLVWDPPWTKDRLSMEAQLELGLL